ncbi:hypothetical protein [Nocardia puris]|uniref:Flagellar biosynthetic protein FliP n=1 Tax=Nocardia puris TaxID=208602 RepID=A0A366D7Z6_9NOCA|nr:hypothetical protein [Nocardia puris]RBO85584.1 hypothetical protein DFR74_114127 [Nocardia puris]
MTERRAHVMVGDETERTPGGTMAHANPRRQRMTGPFARFAWHYLEMVLAMTVGMLLVLPALELATGGLPDRPEIDSLLMAASMSVTMAAWMWFRGHRARPIVEMCLAMSAGFVVLFPPLWTGHLDEMGLMMGGHILMLLFMLAAMLARRDEYTVSHKHHAARKSLPENGSHD